MEISKTDKYEYLNAPCLLENFKQTYLASLNVFLNDDKYKKKTDSLPMLKSSAITRYEKILAKEAQEREKKGIPSPKKHSLQKIQPSPGSKGISMRYIIIDHELIEITLAAIEESNECNSKLTDPFNSYFHENNEKIRKKALEQIVASIVPKSDKNVNGNICKQLAEKSGNSILYHDLEALEAKYKQFDIEDEKLKEFTNTYLKPFKDSCENHGIITLDQKIDYFVYLKKNGIGLGQKKNQSSTTIAKKKYGYGAQGPHGDGSSLHQSSIKDQNKNKIAYSDVGVRYTNELKSKYKLSDDFSSDAWGNFESEIDTKIKSFQFLKKNFEQSSKFIDKLRLHLRWEEVSAETVILRECEINAERFFYLVTKKYFDFSTLRVLNLSHNNLGDTGGCYLFSLIEPFGVKLNYLNVSYNKLGQKSCEMLVNILKGNTVKLNALSIGGNGLGDKLFSEICIGISKNSYITKLFVHDNELGKISSVILGTILKYDRKLKLLDVSKNNFEDDNIGYMLKGLICNTSLEMLMINDMTLTNKSLRIFETTLCINTTLRELFLERNKLNYKGWRVLSDILNKNKYIEYISLVGNNFEIEHFDLVAEQQRQVKLRVISKTDYFLQMSTTNDNINYYEYFY